MVPIGQYILAVNFHSKIFPALFDKEDIRVPASEKDLVNCKIVKCHF